MFVKTYYGSFNLGLRDIIWALVPHGYIRPNIGIFPIFPTFRVPQGVEVLIIVFLCFDREQLLIRGLKALRCFHAKV